MKAFLRSSLLPRAGSRVMLSRYNWLHTSALSNNKVQSAVVLNGSESIRLRVQSKIAAMDAENPYSPVLMDRYERHHDYLRISITEKCNLRCLYCMPAEGIDLQPSEKMLTTEEILRLARLFVDQGVTKIRLTGGEPTVRKDVVELVQELGKLRERGLRTIAMTTNGIAVKRKLPEMVKHGLNALNFSLDTLDKFQFELMTRRKGHERVLESIQQAVDLGVHPVKINNVVMRGVNDH
ncbi:hypothetical protein K7432_006244 [Basidiobolus ranarum]|uniref:Radical SAM core domain-containing protein n=1 Tax=Basidiobolus ranarum TaxID=34480 RepID=A0ABR2WV95_9FUNG